MAVLSVQSVVDSGLTPALSAVNSEDTFVDDGSGRTFLEVVNGGGGSINVTVPAVQTTAVVPGVGALTISNIVVAVTNGQRRFIGPFTPAYRNSSGIVTVQYSGTSSVTAGAFKVVKED